MLCLVAARRPAALGVTSCWGNNSLVQVPLSVCSDPVAIVPTTAGVDILFGSAV